MIKVHGDYTHYREGSMQESIDHWKGLHKDAEEIELKSNDDCCYSAKAYYSDGSAEEITIMEED